MLWIYRLLTFLIAPIALWRLDALGRSTSVLATQAKASRRGVRAIGNQPPQPDVWFHAASVGEVNTIKALVEKALQENLTILVTTFTPTGLEQAQQCFGDRVALAYLPIDTHGAVKRWLDAYQPKALVVAETELWPELFWQCRQRSIPVMLVNARLSTEHFKRYVRFRSLYQHALNAIDVAACQSEDEKSRWQQLGLGADQITVTGNLKAAQIIVSSQSNAAPGVHEFCWVAGSVHPKEYEIIIEAHAKFVDTTPEGVLIIAPRHLDCVDDIQRHLEKHQLSYAQFDPATFGSQASHACVWVVDAFGQLMDAYQVADVAFVGGSLVSVGGHNVYEPASLGKPVITGPHTNQQHEPKKALMAQGALMEIVDAESLTAVLITLADDRGLRQRMGQAGQAVVRQAGESLDRTWAVIRPKLGLGESSQSSQATGAKC